MIKVTRRFKITRFAAIRAFAMKKAGLSETEYATVLSHVSGHDCLLCYKFDVYLMVKEMLEDWEKNRPI